MGVFPLHLIAHVEVSPSINLKLISHEIIFEASNLYVITVSKRYGLSDDILWLRVASPRYAYSIARQKD